MAAALQLPVDVDETDEDVGDELENAGMKRLAVSTVASGSQIAPRCDSRLPPPQMEPKATTRDGGARSRTKLKSNTESS